MTAKEYLSKIQTYRRTMQSYADRIDELYHEASGLKAIVYDKDRVQVSPEQKMEKIFGQIDEVAEKYVKARLRYEQEVQKRIDQIAGMEKSDHERILRLRYIETDSNGEQITLEEIACRMHLSFYRTAHLHGEALEAFRKKYL